MNKKKMITMLCMVLGLALPLLSQAQTGVAGEIKSLQSVLDGLYDDMIPSCKDLIAVGKGISGFAALFYIASRVWRHIANSEQIDFYPLFRPFVLGFAIINFSLVINVIRMVMQPTVSGTSAIVNNTDEAIATLLKMKEQAIKDSKFYQMYVGPNGSGDYNQWYQYYHPGETEGWLDGIGNSVKFALAKASYNFRNSIKEWMSTVLQILFQAAALCINTIRTFYLIVLSILGPLVFGLAVFDGFQQTLTTWLARYINTFLWLPVANIFGSIIGKIQVNMLKIDLAQIAQNGDTFFSTTDAAYLVFMLIGIVGYFTVPAVANYIVNPGGRSGLLHKVTSLSSSTAFMGSNLALSSGNAMAGDIMRSSQNTAKNGYKVGGYLRDKLGGK